MGVQNFYPVPRGRAWWYAPEFWLLFVWIITAIWASRHFSSAWSIKRQKRQSEVSSALVVDESDFMSWMQDEDIVPDPTAKTLDVVPRRDVYDNFLLESVSPDCTESTRLVFPRFSWYGCLCRSTSPRKFFLHNVCGVNQSAVPTLACKHSY